MMKRIYQISLELAISSIITVFMLSSFVFKKQSIKQHHALANARGLSDTIHFRSNVAEGWDIFSSYLSIDADSVEFEVILKCNTHGINNWFTPSLIGTIQTIYAPDSVRVLTYNEPNRKWEITIQPDAGCYLKLLRSTVPLDSVVVIPIKTKYKQ